MSKKKTKKELEKEIKGLNKKTEYLQRVAAELAGSRAEMENQLKDQAEKRGEELKRWAQAAGVSSYIPTLEDMEREGKKNLEIRKDLEAIMGKLGILYPMASSGLERKNAKERLKKLLKEKEKYELALKEKEEWKKAGDEVNIFTPAGMVQEIKGLKEKLESKKREERRQDKVIRRLEEKNSYLKSGRQAMARTLESLTDYMSSAENMLSGSGE